MQRDGGPGGGGQGHGTGGSFTGPAKALEFIGDINWAGWSGEQTTTNASPTTVFDFISPSQALRSRITWTIDRALQDYNKLVGLKVSFNGAVVFFDNGVSHWSDGGYTNLTEFTLIIPTRTQVEIEISTTDTQDIPMTVLVAAVEI
tara:strand:+ start:223 stop:660 length:438 start_codon:yes stop_codon:yes gene_type:complete